MMGFGSGLGMTGFGMGSGGLGGLGGLLLLVVLAIGGVYLWRALERDRTSMGDSQAPKQGQDSALQTLRERYARGEIDHDEYLRRKEGLRAG